MHLNIRQTLITLALFTVAMLTLAACAPRETLPPESKGKIIIVTTIFPLADWARNVGGDRVYVQALLPPGASPHTFDPGPRERRLISHSSLFLKAGLHMDDWGGSLAAGDHKGPQLLSIGDKLLDAGVLPDVSSLEKGTSSISAGDEGHSHEHGTNPHFWLDPELAIKSVEIIRDALSSADPQGAANYKANAQAYIATLKQLNTDLMTTLEPIAGSGLVTYHNAWPYFARRYHLKIVAVIEEYAGKTPSEKYIRGVTDELKRQHLRTIFYEPQLSPGVAKIIAGEVGGDVQMLDPYGTENDPQRGTYLDVMRYNAETLKTAFTVRN